MIGWMDEWRDGLIDRGVGWVKYRFSSWMNKVSKVLQIEMLTH